MTIDPWILTFSALTVLVTIWMGFWSAKKSKTASDFFVAGRSVSVGWNASAISGEYLSAASFMGVAGMVMSSGYDALWYPVCYACGYLFLLLFIAGPLRRFGAYTIPDFAEGRFDSPLFRKIAVVFVLFIGFFYTMPQMKGAGTTLSYIFQDLDFRGTPLAFLAPHDKGEALKGLHYGVGVFLVGAVITLNVALGGMKGITLVQAFQYWAKMFAISVPIFVLMAVYGHYGKHVGENAPQPKADFPVTAKLSTEPRPFRRTLSLFEAADEYARLTGRTLLYSGSPQLDRLDRTMKGRLSRWGLVKGPRLPATMLEFESPLVSGEVITNSPPALADAARLSLVPTANSAGMKVMATGRSRTELAKGLALLEASHVLVSPQHRVLDIWRRLQLNGVTLTAIGKEYLLAAAQPPNAKRTLPANAPPDATWLNPFGPLTTKAAKAAPGTPIYNGPWHTGSVMKAYANVTTHTAKDKLAGINTQVGDTGQVAAALLVMNYAYFLARAEPFNFSTEMKILHSPAVNSLSISWPGFLQAKHRKVADSILTALRTNGVEVVREEKDTFKAFTRKEATIVPLDARPYSLLYTYSLIIALVCGTAGLPHILVRFYTNPDGGAAKRTTMWVMILIGVFYLFPPVFGVMGRNLMPELYNGLTGVKGTDGVVLRLPTILDRQKFGVLGSVLSGITCAGAFAAFMSTFSGLLVSMTGAMAHDVYGRILRPGATAQQRLLAFKIAAVGLGAGAILLGFFVEKFEINKMVGWAFAIAATSYFPLLFLSTWWRGITMKGAATGMLVGGTLSLLAIASTMFADQAAWATGLKDYYAARPLLRILAEQPAIWGLPLAMGLMIVISKLTAKDIPADIRMKMLVLHAPEKLGLKQEYIQEHQQGH